MDALLHEHASPVGRGCARPFRKDADQLVAMFHTPDAGTPAWHRARASTLLRDAQLHALSPVTDAWRRLASRHIATALLLEQQQQVEPDDPVARRRRFFRHD
jgi:hypothetical protein